LQLICQIQLSSNQGFIKELAGLGEAGIRYETEKFANFNNQGKIFPAIKSVRGVNTAWAKKEAGTIVDLKIAE